jgi:hypothetical protein
MSSKKKSQLILKSSDISNLGYQNAGNNYRPERRNADYNGQNGSINEFQTKMTWNNINLRSLLGDLYKDGGCYNICLEQIVFNTTSDLTDLNASRFSTIENNKTFNINMDGLPFTKSYTSKNISSNQVLLTTCRLDACATPTIFYYNDVENTFRLSQNVGVENVNISIFYTDLLNNVFPPTTVLDKAMPYIQLMFSIYEC